MAGTAIRGIDGTSVTAPEGFDFPQWIDRWDRMQRRYLVKREERFAAVADLVRAANAAPTVILDLGCDKRASSRIEAGATSSSCA